MAISMTRKEYEAKYGIAPVIPTASTIDTSVPIPKMTRAEYDAKYNPTKDKKGLNLLGGVKSAINTLGTEYGGSDQGIANKLKKDITEGASRYASEAEKGNIGGATKELLKTGFRTAGDVAGAVYAPAGAVIEATGVNKLFDALGELSQKGKYNPINMLTDIPAVQEWAMKHPNASEDFGRAMNIALGALDKGKINPETAVARTAEQVKAIPGEVQTKVNVAKEVVNTVNKNLKARQNTKITKAISEELGNIENNYAKLNKANQYSKDAGASSRERIAQTDVLNGAVDAEGTIRTKQPGGAIDKYKAQTIDGVEGVVRENLARLKEKVNLAQIKREMVLEVNKSGLEGADLLSALNGIEKEIAGLKLKADTFGNVDLTLAHDAKINTTRNINYQTPPETATYRKAVARAYKKIVEDNSSFKVKEVNGELQKYYDDITRLENLDGRKVKGGKLGKYFAQISGNIIGGAAGSLGGPLGTAIGTIVGGEAAGFIKGKTMARTFGANRGLEVAKNAILEKARIEGKLPSEIDLTVPSKNVGVGKSIKKTPEMYGLEKDIRKNVTQQKAAIAAKDFTLVSKLKEVHDVLVSALKDEIKNYSNNLGNRKTQYKSTSPKKIISPKASISDKSTTTTQKVKGEIPEQLRGIYETAPLAKEYIDNIADAVTNKYKGYVAKTDLKNPTRAMQKVTDEYSGDLSKLTDVARNTVIVDAKNVAKVFDEIVGKENATGKIVDSNKDVLGYSGANIKVKTPNGHTAEIQVNNPNMIFAKESPVNAKNILGDKKYNKLKSKYDAKKIQGGLGHVYYEQFRNLPFSEQALGRSHELAKKSIAYYSQFK